jgi:hypothetical protein
MSDIKARMDELLNDLKRERDELRLKFKLAKLEANEEWVKLEAKIARLEARAREVGNATTEASEDIGAAASLLGEEIREGFRKIAKHL